MAGTGETSRIVHGPCALGVEETGIQQALTSCAQGIGKWEGRDLGKCRGENVAQPGPGRKGTVQRPRTVG